MTLDFTSFRENLVLCSPSLSAWRPDKYAVRFIPRENGIHTIDVKFNGSHIPGSPFQIRVGEPGQTGEHGLVSAYGAGLEKGTTGGTQGLKYSGVVLQFWRFRVPKKKKKTPKKSNGHTDWVRC